MSDVRVDGSSVGAVTTYTFSNVRANHTISASFTTSASTTYTITASAGSNGSISPSGSVILSQGSSRTFTITPNSGYRVSDVRVDGSSVGAVTTYTFSNVRANHTIIASFIANETSSTSLTVTSPAGGEVLYAGGTKMITWLAPSTAVRFSLSYSKNNGYTWTSIADPVTGTSYRWTAPSLAKTYRKCKVRVIGFDAKGKRVGLDRSDAFSINVR